MTLEEKIKIVEAMIREKCDNTIRDYLETLAEIEGIERSQEFEDLQKNISNLRK